MIADTGPSIVIQGIGSYAPERILTNDELSRQLDTSDEWIRPRTGIGARHIAAEGQQTSDLATEAARRALEDAGISEEEVDLIIVGTMSADLLCPATACLVQAKLGCRNVPAFDISAACSGFPYILEAGAAMLRSGSYRHVLVIGAEKMSGILDWQDRTTCILFGDAAGAVVLSRSETPGTGILDSLLGCDGSRPDILYTPAGGTARPASAETLAAREHYLHMEGREVFKLAVSVMEQCVRDILQRNQLEPKDIGCLIPHQANIRIIDHIAKKLSILPEQMHNNIDLYGNTSAASIPLALDEAVKAGKIKRGDYIVLVSFGAGLTWGASLLKW